MVYSLNLLHVFDFSNIFEGMVSGGNFAFRILLKTWVPIIDIGSHSFLMFHALETKVKSRIPCNVSQLTTTFRALLYWTHINMYQIACTQWRSQWGQSAQKMSVGTSRMQLAHSDIEAKNRSQQDCFLTLFLIAPLHSSSVASAPDRPPSHFSDMSAKKT